MLEILLGHQNAKHDGTDVFENVSCSSVARVGCRCINVSLLKFKAEHDLYVKMSDTSRRTTRRARHERVEMLQGPVAGPSTLARNAPAPAQPKSKHSRQGSGSQHGDTSALNEAQGRGKNTVESKTTKVC